MKIDPRHLEILAAIVDEGGLTEGAAALGKSQPSVSRTLSMLEKRLGAELFEPGRRPLRPTELGALLADEGRRIAGAGNRASDLIKDHKSGVRGAIRLAGSPIFLDGVIAPVLASFQSRSPEIRIDQGYGYAPEIIAKLINGTLDVGIVPMRSAEVEDGLQAHQIMPGKNVIACRVGHPLARKSSLALEEIASQPWIAPPPESPLYHDLRAVLSGIGVRDFRVSFSGGSLGSVTNVLSNSDALTVLPFAVVHMMRKQNALTYLPFPIGDPDRHLHVLTRVQPDRSAARERLLTFVKREFEEMQRSMEISRLPKGDGHPAAGRP